MLVTRAARSPRPRTLDFCRLLTSPSPMTRHSRSVSRRVGKSVPAVPPSDDDSFSLLKDASLVKLGVQSVVNTYQWGRTTQVRTKEEAERDGCFYSQAVPARHSGDAAPQGTHRNVSRNNQHARRSRRCASLCSLLPCRAWRCARKLRKLCGRFSWCSHSLAPGRSLHCKTEASVLLPHAEPLHLVTQRLLPART